jgi:hypothetical protein
MSRELRARRWLRLDAAYCAAAGLLALVLARELAGLFDVPAVAVAALGAATLVWASLLALLARRDEWRAPVLVVGVANALAAAGVAASAIAAPATAARLLLVAVALEVAAFAAVQLRLSAYAR